MIVTLTRQELKEYVGRQLEYFFPDGKCRFDGNDIEAALSLALERCEVCFAPNKQYRRFLFEQPKKCGRVADNVLFYHLHADQYASFLYFLANSLWQISQNRSVCDKLLQLNRLLHSVLISYKCKMPSIFYLCHPLGTVLGNAKYDDYLVVMQNVTVATNDAYPENLTPVLGKGVVLASGAKVLGRPSPVIGDFVSVGAGVVISGFNVPSGNVVYTDRQSGNIVIKPASRLSRVFRIFEMDQL